MGLFLMISSHVCGVYEGRESKAAFYLILITKGLATEKISRADLLLPLYSPDARAP